MEALHVLVRFQVPENVPLDGKISLKDLASKTGLDVDMLTRLVRLVAVNYVFVESPPEMISHTAKSKLLATDEGTKVSDDMNTSGQIGRLILSRHGSNLRLLKYSRQCRRQQMR